MLRTTSHGASESQTPTYMDSQMLAPWSKRHQPWKQSAAEKRIHPDFKTLVCDEGSGLQGPWNIQTDSPSGIGTYMPFRTLANSQGEALVVEGLHPRARPAGFLREAHIRTDKDRTTAPDFIFGAASNIRLGPHDEKVPHHPPALLPSIMRYESNGSITEGSGEGGEPLVNLVRSGTFGRRHHFSKKTPPSRRPNDSGSDFYSNSTPSVSSRSIGTQSRKTSPHSLPRTPLLRPSPHSSKPQYSGDLDPYCTVASPNTFGAPTPARADITVCPGRRDHDSYFGFREPPPPLPPLDHPALREALQFKAREWSSSTQSISNSTRNAIVGQGRILQPSPSLPSLRNSHGRKMVLNGGRGRSNSASTEKISVREAIEQHIRPGRKKHSRTQSKSSINSRRSSAEYSARQASSTHGSEHEDCWEVQVSRAVVQLALGEDIQHQETRTLRTSSSSLPKDNKQNSPANYGQARGKNRSTGEALGLGSPFFLQGSQLSGNYSTNFISKFTYSTPKKTAGKSQDMSNGADTTAMNFSESGRTSREPSHGVRTASSSTAGSIKRPRRISLRAKTSGSLTRTPSPPPPRGSLLGAMQGSSTLLAPPSLSSLSTTQEAPSSPTKRTHHKSQPTLPSRSLLQNSSTPPIMEKSYSSGSGKRKADEAGVSGDKTPPKERRSDRTTTFAPDPRIHRVSSTSSHAPSSYHNSKRVRLSSASEGRSGSIRSGSMRFGTLASLSDSPPNAKTTGSWSSRGSHAGPASTGSHSHVHGPPVSHSASYNSQYMANPSNRPPSRRSLSQASIPISALVSPHAPSIARSGTYHMRDPRKPAPVQSTPWGLSLPSHVQEGESRWALRGWVERGGSPLHAWLFFVGFIIFPLWWAAALFIPIPRTRRLPGTDAEKGVILDDPQVEHGAHILAFIHRYHSYGPNICGFSALHN
ncbi:hypothetical protein CVT24_007216 [Panaeolus cyanescens]|uniref:Uncharacterized protein n=1 Tax=Panaeolus cyanescens TaxID=181874 RepID=A0A409VJI6_9AGAR|nr:hypothetical protein CVT24_007216 [Panaeolus cyanescens]